jgi:hypothetical protein
VTSPLVQDDSAYRDTLLGPVRLCLDYRPKLGQSDVDIDLPAFRTLYGVDPLYHWMGFDSDLMYAAHKAAGGMTSLYRQLGIGCERLFRLILRDSLGLTADQVAWSYQKVEGSRTRTLTLDGRIQVDEIRDSVVAERVRNWIEYQKEVLGVSVPLGGAVFEVRQGYKSADSKRQNADLGNASQALGDGYLPVLAIMSSQVNQAVRTRYQVGKWAVLMGLLGRNDPLVSTFDFVREVVGYDLEGFFLRNHEQLRAETEEILKRLLTAS